MPIWLKMLPVAALMLGFSGQALADQGIAFMSVFDGESNQEYSVKVQILLLMTALSFLPSMLLMMTSFHPHHRGAGDSPSGIGPAAEPTKPDFDRYRPDPDHAANEAGLGSHLYRCLYAL